MISPPTKPCYSMLFFLSCYLPEPWFTIPPKEATIKRYICKGFTCETSKYLPHQSEEFDTVIENYLADKYPNGLKSKMESYIERGFYPAYCAAGYFALLGTAGYQQNLTESYELLQKGAQLDLWACYDILSFHPFTKNLTIAN